MPDLQTKQTYSLMTLLLVAGGTALVAIWAANNVSAVRNIVR
ncbi:hypothetical protein [Rheinheimera sp.]|jgi:hypothetical protein|nr:hypothetical protein [Rheinheimera sp.]